MDAALDARMIDLEINVPGTPEEVWRAIATGPGISSWYVPHSIDEREGGEANASFGDDPSTKATGRVAAWEPPDRIVMDSGKPDEGLVFEWLINTNPDQTCSVRLINSGFEGSEWETHQQAMHDGWLLFLSNLRLHLTHHSGDTAEVGLPMVYASTANGSAVWATTTGALGIPAAAEPGDRITTHGPGVPHMSGIVAELLQPRGASLRHRYLVRVDDPVPGTAFVAVEDHGQVTSVSVWTYLYGPDAAAATAALDSRFGQVLGDVAAQFE